MESQYRQFGSSEHSSVHVQGEQTIPIQRGRKNIVVYVLYGILVLLLLILLLVTGIKLSQLSKEIADVKLYIGRNNHKPAGSVQPVYLEALTPVRDRCREGWSSFQNSCYLLSNAVLTWKQAETQCQTLGGHLLVLNDVHELDYISRIIDIRYSFWIGLVERQHEGHWSWVDGTDFSSTPTFWDEGQPDNWDYRENGEDCGQLHGSEKRKRKMWNDADCFLQYRYICEAKA
ncbi:C-type lectin domain family 4 member E-like [Sphaeramia orbicularis]|uniref:C-type lectin domain family 4 member E-like n=1 Tax=Sphaeramia orbicularis TaxID=375764 RepID=UPI00117DA730|nr:C-type lectin domain family 4 member E-like [Sphaeramia orbicularis]